MFITYTLELTLQLVGLIVKTEFMATSSSTSDITTPVRQSHMPVEPTVVRGSDPNEREDVEIPLPPCDNPNMEVHEEVIDEWPKRLM